MAITQLLPRARMREAGLSNRFCLLLLIIIIIIRTLQQYNGI